MDTRPDSVFSRWLQAETTLVESPVSSSSLSASEEDEVEELMEQESGYGPEWEWTPPKLELGSQDARTYRRELTGQTEDAPSRSRSGSPRRVARMRETLLHPFAARRSRRASNAGEAAKEGTVEVGGVGYEIVKPLPPTPPLPRRVLVRPSRSRKGSEAAFLTPSPAILSPASTTPPTTPPPSSRTPSSHRQNSTPVPFPARPPLSHSAHGPHLPLRTSRSLPSHGAFSAVVPGQDSSSSSASTESALSRTSSGRGRIPAFPPEPVPGTASSEVRRQRSQRSLRSLARRGRFNSNASAFEAWRLGTSDDGEDGDEDDTTEELATPALYPASEEPSPTSTPRVSVLAPTSTVLSGPIYHRPSTTAYPHLPSVSVSLSDFFPPTPPSPLAHPRPAPPTFLRTQTEPLAPTSAWASVVSSAATLRPTSTVTTVRGRRSPAFQTDWEAYESEEEREREREREPKEWQVGEVVRLRTVGDLRGGRWDGRQRRGKWEPAIGQAF